MSIEDGIKKTILEFIVQLREHVFTEEVEKGDLMTVEFFFKKLHSFDVSSHVVEHVLPYASHIRKKNIEFFKKKKAKIFEGLPEDRINYFSSLVELDVADGGFSQGDKDTVWEYFVLLVDLAEKLKKKI